MCRRSTSLVLLLVATTALRAQDVTLAVVLERLHQYLRDYAEVLPATVAIERYQQSFDLERVLLESEFGILGLPNHPQWLGFRDIMKVNGKALAGRDRRLSALFENPTVSAIEQARLNNIPVWIVRFVETSRPTRLFRWHINAAG